MSWAWIGMVGILTKGILGPNAIQWSWRKWSVLGLGSKFKTYIWSGSKKKVQGPRPWCPTEYVGCQVNCDHVHTSSDPICHILKEYCTWSGKRNMFSASSSKARPSGRIVIPQGVQSGWFLRMMVAYYQTLQDIHLFRRSFQKMWKLSFEGRWKETIQRRFQLNGANLGTSMAILTVDRVKKNGSS